MKAVILAGGLGTRISEETDLKPKPMISIGGMPILWHIMKMYSHHGINEFVVCCGYKGYVIKEYFANYFLHMVKATVTAVLPPGRFGALDVTGNRVNSFREKPQGDGANVNGGFFVLSTKVIDYISGDKTIWERGPIERLSKEGDLAAYQHGGFWQPMDTLRDKIHLEELWQSGKAPWKVWQ